MKDSFCNIYYVIWFLIKKKLPLQILIVNPIKSLFYNFSVKFSLLITVETLLYYAKNNLYVRSIEVALFKELLIDEQLLLYC